MADPLLLKYPADHLNGQVFDHRYASSFLVCLSDPALARRNYQHLDADAGRLSLWRRNFRKVVPRTTCRSVRDGDLSALWLGPDEWLITTLAPNEDWVTHLSSRIEGSPYSLVDVSHRQVGLTVQGHGAEQILASACALDLSLAAFPVGIGTRTMFAKAEIILWRTGTTQFHVEVWRSFARYIEALLREAEREI